MGHPAALGHASGSRFSQWKPFGIQSQGWDQPWLCDRSVIAAKRRGDGVTVRPWRDLSPLGMAVKHSGGGTLLFGDPGRGFITTKVHIASSPVGIQSAMGTAVEHPRPPRCTSPLLSYLRPQEPRAQYEDIASCITARQ